MIIRAVLIICTKHCDLRCICIILLLKCMWERKKKSSAMPSGIALSLYSLPLILFFDISISLRCVSVQFNTLFTPFFSLLTIIFCLSARHSTLLFFSHVSGLDKVLLLYTEIWGAMSFLCVTLLCYFCLFVTKYWCLWWGMRHLSLNSTHLMLLFTASHQHQSH